MMKELALAIWLEVSYWDYLSEFSYSDIPGRRYYFAASLIRAIERGETARVTAGTVLP